MRQPRFAPAVRTEVMPGQPRSGTAGAVERFSLRAPSQLRERLLPGTVTTRVRIPQRRRHRSATVRLRRQTRPGRARVLPHPGFRQRLMDRRGIGGATFIKTAGTDAPPTPGVPTPYFDHSGRVRLLGNAMNLVRSCDHPALAALLNVVETPTSPMLVYRAAPGELIGGQATPGIRQPNSVPVPHRPTSDSPTCQSRRSCRSSTR